MTAISLLWIAIGVLALAIIYLAFKVYQLRDEVTEGKYLIAERGEDGGFTIRNSKGKIIFKL